MLHHASPASPLSVSWALPSLPSPCISLKTWNVFRQTRLRQEFSCFRFFTNHKTWYCRVNFLSVQFSSLTIQLFFHYLPARPFPSLESPLPLPLLRLGTSRGETWNAKEGKNFTQFNQDSFHLPRRTLLLHLLSQTEGLGGIGNRTIKCDFIQNIRKFC